MMQKKFGSTVIVLFLAACFSVACTSVTKSSIVGKWKSNSSESWEFKSDDKFERVTPLEIPITGSYSVDGENVVLKFDPRNETSEAPEPLKVKIVIKGNEMSLNDGQRIFTYKRE